MIRDCSKPKFSYLGERDRKEEKGYRKKERGVLSLPSTCKKKKKKEATTIFLKKHFSYKNEFIQEEINLTK